MYNKVGNNINEKKLKPILLQNKYYIGKQGVTLNKGKERKGYVQLCLSHGLFCLALLQEASL